ncbi:hypothetical protein F5B22DRAFT_192195 [Xylaria bambusicola]|uniref:uncharacterized protein n=1 Tax=Xylaria bambusicola TaxID=326684 RepID=UPI00200750C4|nr:uncharacterized protein F5B22DRAFT_192195 [Xylaria bambusicola]KAI0515195.1 hypothetical protein F5B22DRAFT_192195 [Xylaria bambusicola]
MSDRIPHLRESSVDFEDNYTFDRPPQLNLSTQPAGGSSPNGASTVSQAAVITDQTPRRMASSQLEEAGQHYPASDSTATVMADEVAAATQAALPRLDPVVRAHILFHVNRDYNGAVQPLTEGAVAALNHDYAYSSVAEWVQGRSQFSPADQLGFDMSNMLPSRIRTSTAARTGSTVESSCTMVSRSTLKSTKTWGAHTVCAAGQQFEDVCTPIYHSHLSLDDCEDCT